MESAREHTYDLRSLERFEFIDAKGKDQGINGAFCRLSETPLLYSCVSMYKIVYVCVSVIFCLFDAHSHFF